MAMSKNATRRPRATLALAMPALLWGCVSDRPTVPTEGPVSFANDVQPTLRGQLRSLWLPWQQRQPT